MREIIYLEIGRDAIMLFSILRTELPHVDYSSLDKQKRKGEVLRKK